MLTAAGDEEKYNKWFTILKQVALWLVMIGLAWFIVSMIFYLIGIIT
jgi:preprotein translocase subunit Sss1